jgi:glycosyltransferase involved in cell wall biosynthesis
MIQHSLPQNESDSPVSPERTGGRCPLVSVVMCVYNGAPYLESAAESVLRQTLSDLEFLIIDDGSTDDTWAILTGLAARDARVRLIRSVRNTGITRSINRLFALARGQYVTRHDADDISLPTRLARQVAWLESHPAIGLVSCQVEMIDSSGAPIDLQYFSSATDDSTLQRQLLENNCFCQGSVVFRRDCLTQVGLLDESLEFAEDYDLWLRMAEMTRLARLDEMLFQYRFHPASVTNTRRADQTLHIAEALEKTLRRRFRAEPPAALVARTARYFRLAARHYYSRGDTQKTRDCLISALRLWPLALDFDHEEISIDPTPAGLALIESVFAALPRTRQLTRLKASCISSQHMRQVFEGLKSGDWVQIEANLWPGIRHNPRWLLNRGVLSLARQSIIHRLQAGGNRPR